MRVGLWSKLSTEELMLLNFGVGEDSWESLGLKGGPTSLFWRSALGFLWRELCWSWNSHTLATSCEELTHWKRLWCWEGLGAGGEGNDRGWDSWMTSLTRNMWVWLNSVSWWWTGRPGVLRFMGSQSQTWWVTELSWTEWSSGFPTFFNLHLNLAIKSSWWATVSPQSCFCWLYRASPSLAAENIINMISVLTSGAVHV